VTGISDLQIDLIPKGLELLKTAVPGVSRVVLLHGRYSGFSQSQLTANAQQQTMAARRRV
jgi:hypothetical protein